MINRQIFYVLFVNANCLAELGLRSASTEVDSLLDDLDSLDINALEGELPTQLDDLNFAAMDGLEFYDAEVEADTSETVAETSTLDGIEERQTDETIYSIEQTAEFDIDIYMANVYTHEAYLSERVDSAFQKVDQNQLAALLSQLPSELPCFSEKLTGEQMTLWLDQYSNDIEAIINLLVTIRELDFI